MQRIDSDRFGQLMAEVFECFDRRPPSAAALVHWSDALADYSFIAVEDVLRNWLRERTKAPVIAEIVSICSERAISGRERRAEADKIAFARPCEWRGVTPFGSQCIAEMREMLKSPKQPSRDWAYRIMDNPSSTEMQRDFARSVVHPPLNREPGEDREEAAE